ncbi:MAG: hypothetical protein IT370_14170 [Deltaproteobacteria bacterium]|nr:hypothetical protein [Deltaproteobacteria bacterium]
MGRLVPSIICCAALASSSAAAPQPIALESTDAASSPDPSVNEVLTPLYDELAKHGALVGEPLGARIEAVLSRPGDAMSAAELADFTQAVERGYQSFQRAQPDDAVKELEHALSLARARPAAFALEQSLRDLLQRALIGVALSYVRVGKQEAADLAIHELLVHFPDRPIERRKYGPEPLELAKRVRTGLEQAGLARLSIDVADDRAAVIFLDGRFLAVGNADVADVLPGKHTVFIRGTLAGRIHYVELPAKGSATLHLSMGLDSVLSTTGPPALRFSGPTERLSNEPRLASALASALGSRTVITVAVRRFEGRPAIIGTVYQQGNGQPSRAAAVAIEPAADQDAVRGLARFLINGGKLPPNVRPVRDSAAKRRPVREGSGGGRRPLRPWKFVALGTGVVALGVGGYWLAVDGNEACDNAPCLDARDTATIGYIAAGVGIAAIATSVVLWIKDKPRREASTSSLDLLPQPGGLRVAWSGSF